MKALSVIVSLACLTFLSGSALAEQPSQGDLFPTLTLGVQFGGALKMNTPLRYTAQFDLSPRFAHLKETQGQNATPLSAWRNFKDGRAAPSRLTVFRTTLNSNGFESARVFGREMLVEDLRLNETAAGTEAGSNSWLWWVAGGVAVAAGVALAVSGGSKDESNSGPSGPSSGCNIGSSDGNVGPNPVVPSIISNCPPLPNIP